MKNINLEQKKGFLNRHINPLPDKECIIKALVKTDDGEHVYLCEWQPSNKKQKYLKKYIGTATVIENKFKGIGFHAWQQNDSEFIYYSIIEKNVPSTKTNKDIVKLILELPPEICYKGVHFVLEIFHNYKELRLCYDFSYVDEKSKYKKTWDKNENWKNPFDNGHRCSWLYLYESIENENDLIKAIKHCRQFLDKNKL